MLTKLLCCTFLFVGARAAIDLSAPLSSINQDIFSVYKGHHANLMNAHRVIQSVDLQAHREAVLGEMHQQIQSFAPQTLQECSDAGAALQAAGQGCSTVFDIFNNNFTDVNGANALMTAHCTGSCHTDLVTALAQVAIKCSPFLSQLSDGIFVQRLKAAILLTEMPCIRDDDNTKYCMSDIVRLRAASNDPGVTAAPPENTLALYCTRCIVKLFSAAATFAPDYARIQFSLMASYCWRFPANGPYCVLKFAELANESPAQRDAENGTSQAHLDLLCHPCVRIFLRRVAILYADPLLRPVFLPHAIVLFRVVHALDIFCVARAVGQYCVRELKADADAGMFDNIVPDPSKPCYQAMVANGNTCPQCATQIVQLLTSHGCCAIALFKIADYLSYIDDSGTLAADNRDDPAFPSNMMIKGFNDKCSNAVNVIRAYCTAVAVTFVLTLRNIAFTYYAAHAVAFHNMVKSDIAEFLGMVQDDIKIPDAAGSQVMGSQAPWYSSFVPASFQPLDASGGVTLEVSVWPSNADQGASISGFVSGSLSDGSIPFPNTASDIRFLADPTVAVTAQSSATSVVASLALLIVLIALNL